MVEFQQKINKNSNSNKSFELLFLEKHNQRTLEVNWCIPIYQVMSNGVVT